MRWEDERYVRLYTRDTVDWEMLPWQSRALFPLLLRKVDRAGIIELGKHGAAGLAHVVRLPADVTEAGLAGLLDDGSVELHDNTLVVRNFIEAQEAVADGAQRTREWRARARDLAKAFAKASSLGVVTKRHDAKQNVTRGDETSRERDVVRRGVTNGDSVPIRTVPSRTQEDPPAASATGPKVKSAKVRPGWTDLIALYTDTWKALHSSEGKPPAIEGADVSALARVYDAVGIDETKALIQRFVSDSDLHITRRGHMLRDLPSRLNAYRAKQPKSGAASKRNFREPMPHQEETVDETDKL
jgi:hypothetical protein